MTLVLCGCMSDKMSGIYSFNSPKREEGEQRLQNAESSLRKMRHPGDKKQGETRFKKQRKSNHIPTMSKDW